MTGAVSSIRRARAAVACLSLVGTACFIYMGPDEAAVYPSRLDTVPDSSAPTPAADLLLRPFADARTERRQSFIGAYGSDELIWGRLQLWGDETLPDLMTRYLARAFEAAGYRTFIEGRPSSERPRDFEPVATVSGRIDEFWLWAAGHVAHPMRSMRSTHAVSVYVDVMDGDRLVWEGFYEAEEEAITWLGNTAEEYEVLMRRSLDDVLAQAAAEFASEDFVSRLRNSEQRNGGKPLPPAEPVENDSLRASSLRDR